MLNTYTWTIYNRYMFILFHILLCYFDNNWSKLEHQNYENLEKIIKTNNLNKKWKKIYYIIFYQIKNKSINLY